MPKRFVSGVRFEKDFCLRKIFNREKRRIIMFWTLEEEKKGWIQEIYQKVERKYRQVRERSKDKIPAMAINGVHDDRSDTSKEWGIDNGLNWWTNGFFAGILWQLYQAGKDERYAEIARISEEKMDACFLAYYGLHHDVGFMWLPTAVADYRLTGNLDSRRRGLLAANLLAGRFNPAGKFIRAWNELDGAKERNRGWAIIDCMFNIPLLYWASEELDDPRYRQIAMLHADTAMRYFIRENGSVRHIIEFDAESGNYLRSHGGQGYGHGSSWTRGQTWAIYGFALSYLHTGKKEYLDTAVRVADYFKGRLNAECLVPIDFDQPAEPAYEDSTAAAIAACGFLELGEILKERGKGYFETGLRLFSVLTEKRCDFSEDTDGILQKCSGSYHGTSDREVNFVYADYYYVEALLRLMDKRFLIF